MDELLPSWATFPLFSGHTARGILAPRPVINLVPHPPTPAPARHWKLSLNYWINTEVPTNFIFIQIKYANTNTYILVNVHAIYKFMQNELE